MKGIKQLATLALSALLVFAFLPIAPQAVPQARAEDLEGHAYAVLSSDGTTMTFVRSHDTFENPNPLRHFLDDTTVTGLDGKEYTGTVFYDVETSDFTQTNSAGSAGNNWHVDGPEYFYNVTTVNFVDEIRPVSTARWFENMHSLTTINSFDKLDTSLVTNMSGMFCECYSLKHIDLSVLDTSKVTDMSSMFGYCRSLASLDVSPLDTSNVTDMSYMFDGCASLTKLDLSTFDTAKVTDMFAMFGECTSLTSLDLRAFDTSKVTNMGGMFMACTALKSVNVSSFNTSQATEMRYLFCDCPSLTSLDLRSFDISHASSLEGMFSSTCANNDTGTPYPGWTVTDAIAASFNDSSKTGIDTAKLLFNAKPLDSPATSADEKISQVASELKTTRGEKDAAGSTFGLLQLRCVKVGKKSVKLKWNRIRGAKTYVLFSNKCGKKGYKILKKLSKRTLTVKKVAGKKLKKGAYYKFFVAAFYGSGNKAAVSKTVHIATKGGKVGNFKSVKVRNVKKGKLSLKRKKTFKLKTKSIRQSKKLKVKIHRKTKFESSNKKVATVSGKGVIKGKAKGTCTVYAYAQSGAFAKVKVTVR